MKEPFWTPTDAGDDYEFVCYDQEHKDIGAADFAKWRDGHTERCGFLGHFTYHDALDMPKWAERITP